MIDREARVAALLRFVLDVDARRAPRLDTLAYLAAGIRAWLLEGGHLDSHLDLKPGRGGRHSTPQAILLREWGPRVLVLDGISNHDLTRQPADVAASSEHDDEAC